MVGGECCGKLSAMQPSGQGGSHSSDKDRQTDPVPPFSLAFEGPQGEPQEVWEEDTWAWVPTLTSEYLCTGTHGYRHVQIHTQHAPMPINIHTRTNKDHSTGSPAY